MKILYVCAPGDENARKTAELIAKAMPGHDFLLPELPEFPLEIHSFLRERDTAFDPDVIVGSRLGGFYAMLICGPTKLLIDPVMTPHKGPHPFLRDGDERTREELRRLHDAYFSDWKDFETTGEVWGLFGTDRSELPDALKFKREFSLVKGRFMTDGFSLAPDEEQIKSAIVPAIERVFADEIVALSFSDMDESCFL